MTSANVATLGLVDRLKVERVCFGPLVPSRARGAERPRDESSGCLRVPTETRDVPQADERASFPVGSHVLLRTQCTRQALLSLAEVAAFGPEPPETRCEGQAIETAGRIGEAPVDRCPQVVMLHVQSTEPDGLVGSDDLRLRLSCEREEVVQVRVAECGDLA